MSKENGTWGISYSKLKSFFGNGNWDPVWVNSKAKWLICGSTGLRPWVSIVLKKSAANHVRVYITTPRLLEVVHRVTCWILNLVSIRFFMKDSDCKNKVTCPSPEARVSVQGSQKVRTVAFVLWARWEVEHPFLLSARFIRHKSLLKKYFRIDLAYPLSEGE